VISHSAGDEGTAYETYLHSLAELLGVRVIFASGVVNHRRGQTADGRKIYSLADVYHHADLVTYPSTVEGFGNAFLETLYYSKPIVMCTYEIFKRDIEPKGFRVVGFKDFVTDEAVRQAKVILEGSAVVAEMTAHNYELGRRYYSYDVLRDNLVVLVNQIMGL
jgi:hypothetical protein